MKIDWNHTADDYAEHRAGFPPSIFPRLEKFEVGKWGQTILDLGAGTGTLGRGFAKQGSRVVGLDLAHAMMVGGQGKDRAAGLSTQYVNAYAERLPVADGIADVVSAGQCWHWFDQAVIFDEVRRVLKPGGTLVIAHFDWLPVPGNVVSATEALILRYNPNWLGYGGDGMHADWLPGMMGAGFRGIETFSYDVPVPYTPEAWRGRIRASAGISASLSPEEVTAFDAELAGLLAKNFPEERLEIPHRVFAIVGYLVKDKRATS